MTVPSDQFLKLIICLFWQLSESLHPVSQLKLRFPTISIHHSLRCKQIINYIMQITNKLRKVASRPKLPKKELKTNKLEPKKVLKFNKTMSTKKSKIKTLESISALETRKSTKSKTNKNDEKFIEKLFSRQRNDENILGKGTCQRSIEPDSEYLKRILSTLMLKVYDLSLGISKESSSEGTQRKNAQILKYMDSIIKQLNLEPGYPHKSRSRCHTESLKLPIEDYLESVKKKEEELNSLTEMIEFMSRRNSLKSDPQDMKLTATHEHIPSKPHELEIRKGDHVTVLKQIPNNRLMCINRGTLGYCPRAVFMQ